jgi:hypothetical protein
LVGPAAALLVLGGYLIFRRFDLPDEVEMDAGVTHLSSAATD